MTDVTCGVVGHDIDCLCDVVVTEPAPILADWVSNSWLGRALVGRLGLSAPWTDDKILYLLEEQTKAHDIFVGVKPDITPEEAERMKRVRSFRQKRLNKEQLEQLRVMTHAGATSGQLRKFCASEWNVVISKSWSCKLRVQLLKAEEII
jgi:hypothetical protein